MNLNNVDIFVSDDERLKNRIISEFLVLDHPIKVIFAPHRTQAQRVFPRAIQRKSACESIFSLRRGAYIMI